MSILDYPVPKHKIYARHSKTISPKDRLSIPLIKRTVLTALRVLNVELPCEISILVTDERTIREINHEFRGIDKPTDVLSFPMQELTPMIALTIDGWESKEVDSIDPETGLLPLGEIVISATRTQKQALQLGHSRDYETSYLTIHSVLHLLGYDHVNEAEDKRQIRDNEKKIMSELGFEN
jgi:probable rRNA maturation factor